MRDLRRRYTYDQRLEFNDNVQTIRRYLLYVLLDRQGNTCALCHLPAVAYDIDHIVYNPMMTAQHCRALCIPCHKDVTNFVPFRNRPRV